MDAPPSPFGPADGDEYDAPGSAIVGGSNAVSEKSQTGGIVLGGGLTLEGEPLRWQPCAEVRVGSPEKHGEGFKDAYVSYEVATRWKDGRQRETRVRRRYQDFVWLVERYSVDKAAGAVVPPLPERNRLGFMDRFGPEFVRRRQEALQRFLHRLLAHPRLGQHAALREFLTADVLALTTDRGPATLSSDACVASEASQASFFDAENLPVPEGAGEEAFLVMRRAIGTIEGHFERVSGLHARALSAARGLSRASIDMRAGATQFSKALCRLDALLPELSAAEASVLAGVLVPGVRSPPSSPHSDTANGLADTLRELHSGGHSDDPAGDAIDRTAEDTPGTEEKSVAHQTSPSVPQVKLHTLFEDIAACAYDVGQLQHDLSERLDYGVAAPSSEFAACCRSSRHALRLSDGCRQTYRAARDGLAALEREYASLIGDSPNADGDQKSDQSEKDNSPRPSGDTRPKLAVEAGSGSRPVPSQQQTQSPPAWTSFVSYLSSRIDAMRGRDTDAARAERAEKLCAKIISARVERATALRHSLEMDACVQSEFATFLRVLDAEFRDVFVPALAEHIRKYRRSEREAVLRHHALFFADTPTGSDS